MRKWLALVVPVVLLVTGGSRLVADGAANLAYLDLLPHLAQVLPALKLPDCEERADVSGARMLLRSGNSTIANGWAAWLERDCAVAEASWERACTQSSSHQEGLSCLWLFLSTQGEVGVIPQVELESELMAAYSYRFGKWAARAQLPSYAEFAQELSLSLLRPEDVGYWQVRAQAAALEEDWEAAASAYGRAGRLSDDAYRFWWEQGRAFQRAGDGACAVQSFGRALMARPSHHVSYRMIGQIYSQRELDNQARNWLYKALQIAPKNAQNNYYMAQYFHRLGEQDRAVMYLAQAVESHNRQPWRWAVQLGDWRLALGDRDGALEAYRQALAWQPGEASIEERIEQVTEN
jgi:tetratricopeptide (TPR) repeat protein